MPSAPASSCFFQPWISVGWIECWLANSATVLSPLKAAKATCALNAAMWVFRLPAIVAPFLVSRLLSSLIDCPVFGVHYRHQSRAVRRPHRRGTCLFTVPPAASRADPRRHEHHLHGAENIGA